jgi:hypothetical protein
VKTATKPKVVYDNRKSDEYKQALAKCAKRWPDENSDKRRKPIFAEYIIGEEIVSDEAEAIKIAREYAESEKCEVQVLCETFRLAWRWAEYDDNKQLVEPEGWQQDGYLDSIALYCVKG